MSRTRPRGGHPALAVIAKAPAPGRSKTRLCPPLSPEQAADLAEASLLDTLAAMSDGGDGRKAIILDGRAGSWLPDGFELIEQRGAGLGERLANAFEDLGGPALVVGMDTPQLDGAVLLEALAGLEDAPAVLGPAVDGGYWGIGLRHPDARVFTGVPMSASRTCAAQRARLRALGIEWAELRTLCDVDTFADAVAVAGSAPHTRFAEALATLRCIEARSAPVPSRAAA